MKKNALIFPVLFLLLSGVNIGVHAQTISSKQQYTEDTKRAATRYADDKKLCAEESTSASRMQCLRDAKTEYNNALATAKSNMQAVTVSTKSGASCAGCGRVLSVNVSDKEGEGSALGLIAGGVAGALLGNQVGNGTGRDLATVAGAAGGAYAGRKIEQKAKSSKVWAVAVQYDNGDKNTFNFDHDPGFGSGDLVRNSGDSIIRR